MAVFYVVAPSSLVEADLRFICAYCLYYQGDEDGGSKNLRNVG
jgi:hypothetical protein